MVVKSGILPLLSLLFLALSGCSDVENTEEYRLGYEAGYQTGHEEGKEEGIEEGREEICDEIEYRFNLGARNAICD